MTIGDEAQMLAAARRIAAMGPQCVLVKGGHLPGSPVDLLVDGDQVIRFPGQRIDSVHTHGTGCTLASAIASRLAIGDDVPTRGPGGQGVRDRRDQRPGSRWAPGSGPSTTAGGCGRTRGQRVTLPALMQEVQTFRRRGVLPTMARTR